MLDTREEEGWVGGKEVFDHDDDNVEWLDGESSSKERFGDEIGGSGEMVMES